MLSPTVELNRLLDELTEASKKMEQVRSAWGINFTTDIPDYQTHFWAADHARSGIHALFIRVQDEAKQEGRTEIKGWGRQIS